MMKLKHPFSNETRWLFFDARYRCLNCGSNCGVELHHILGRVSSSPWNCCPLCHICHASVVHNQTEHQRLFALTLRFLFEQRYTPTIEDYEFFRINHRELDSKELQHWLKMTYKNPY